MSRHSGAAALHIKVTQKGKENIGLYTDISARSHTAAGAFPPIQRCSGLQYSEYSRAAAPYLDEKSSAGVPQRRQKAPRV